MISMGYDGTKETTIVLIVLGLILAAGVWLISTGQLKVSGTEDCDRFANTPTKDVPARCIREFQK